jgi:rod shape-determining protein MreC
MASFLKRSRGLITLVALVVLASLAMVTDQRDREARLGELPWWQAWVLEVTAPIQKIVAGPVVGVQDIWASYVDLLEVREDNESLQARIDDLEEVVLQYREALVASGHLQRIAAMRDEFEVPMLPAEVVGLDVSLGFRSVTVDRGANHGVRSGNPVITHDGVVGLVTATSNNASRSMLLLDRQSAIAGIVQRTRARGVVRGNGSGDLEFDFFVRLGNVNPGDVVITSGLDSAYPKGLKIGVVSELIDSKGGLIQTAIVRPAVDFGRLEQVFVMFQQGPTMELIYGDADGDKEDQVAEVSSGRETGAATP